MKRILAYTIVIIFLSSAAVADQVTLSFPDVSELPIHSVEQAKAKANIIAFCLTSAPVEQISGIA